VGDDITAIRPVTVNWQVKLYERLKRRTEYTRRTVESELMEVVADALPASQDLPGELAETISTLEVLDDQALWRAARSHLAVEAAPQATAQMSSLVVAARRRSTGIPA
jgi:hypothetical protein